MTGYTKLFSSILDSTIWDEDCATRILWVTMLAMANKDGEVLTSLASLLTRARLTLTDVNSALATLLASDQQSRTSANDGRRIEKIEGGWKILNYKRYRAKRDRHNYMRSYMRKYRAVNQKSKPDVSQQLATCKPKLADSIYNTSVPKESNLSVHNPPLTPPFQGGDINFKNPELQTQPRRTKLRECPVPGCRNLCPAGETYCSDLHKQWAENELKRGKA